MDAASAVRRGDFWPLNIAVDGTDINAAHAAAQSMVRVCIGRPEQQERRHRQTAENTPPVQVGRR